MSADAAQRAGRRMPTWLVSTVAGVFGLFYAYLIWNGVAFAIAQSGDGTGVQDWAALALAIVFPVVAFVVAVVIGFRRRFVDLALVLLLGLAVSAVVWLNVLAYAWGVVSSQLIG